MELGLKFENGETRWTRDTVMSIGVLSLFAGAAAGALGIAAALLIGPLLLQVSPELLHPMPVPAHTCECCCSDVPSARMLET